jgi:hypothetical protein
LARRRRPNEVERLKVDACQEFERVTLDKPIAAIVRLRLNVDADNGEAGLLQSASNAAGSGVEIERLH